MELFVQARRGKTEEEGKREMGERKRRKGKEKERKEEKRKEEKRRERRKKEKEVAYASRGRVLLLLGMPLSWGHSMAMELSPNIRAGSK